MVLQIHVYIYFKDDVFSHMLTTFTLCNYLLEFPELDSQNLSTCFH